MKNLSVKAEQIYDILKSKATSQDKDGHFCIYPVKELAMDCNINSRTVMRALKELEQNGYILRKRQDDHQTQRIYLLKNVTCSTVSGKNVTCSTMRGENVTCSTVSGENVTCSTVSGENVTCSTVSGENVTCSTMRGENVTCSTVSGENVPSTRCGENVHTSTERVEKLFLMIRQGFGLSAFTLQATSQKVEPNIDAFTGKATLEFKDIKVLIEEYSKHKNLTVPTMQLLDFMDIRLTERGMKSPSVEFTVDEYMQYRRLSDRKSIREQIQSAIEELKSISLEWEEKRGKRQIEYKFMNIADSGYVSRNGKITFTFGTTFFGVLKTYSVMSYPEQLGQINSRLNPNSYNFLRKISEHKNMNTGKKNENIISVETLLSCANALPSYDEVMASDRHISSRIIEPFLRDMNALVPTLQWEFCKKNTGEMLSDDEVELDYYTFKNLNVRITWNNYPDQTKKLERKATSTNSGKGRFHLRRKILSK